MLPFPLRNTAIQAVKVQPEPPSPSDFWEGNAQSSIDEMKRAKVYSADDEMKLLRSFEDVLNHQPPYSFTLLVFLRRFGCPVCRYATDLINASAVSTGLSRLKELALQSLNVRLIAVAIEDIGYEEFKKQEYFKGEIYINEDGTMFSMLRLKRLGVQNAFGLLDVPKMNAALELASGDYFNRTRDFKGNLVQLGGLFIMNSRCDRFLFRHREEYAGDTPPVTSILEALRAPDEVFNLFPDRDKRILNLAREAQPSTERSAEY